MGAARDVGEGLVDRNPLHQRREIVEHVDGGIAQPLVLVEMTIDEGEVRAQLARPSPRHAAAHSEGLGLVRGGEHDAAADGDGLAVQGRIEQLLDRCIEGIEVGMENGRCRFHPTVRREMSEMADENKRRTRSQWLNAPRASMSALASFANSSWTSR